MLEVEEDIRGGEEWGTGMRGLCVCYPAEEWRQALVGVETPRFPLQTPRGHSPAWSRSLPLPSLRQPQKKHRGPHPQGRRLADFC